MVKVFRGFRKKWLQEGQVRKYFLYAIGEIFLVVIGILIALSINNWNNEQELRKSEKLIYSNILKKIQEDKNDIEGNINYNDEHMAQFQNAIEIIEENNRDSIDVLKMSMINLFNYSDFNGNENIYQNLVNSGELKLLKNDEIIEGLQELEEQYIYANRMESNHWQVIMRFVGPGLIDNIHFSDMTVERPNELYTFQFQNLFIAMMEIMSEKDGVYKNCIHLIDEVSGLIEMELEEE